MRDMIPNGRRSMWSVRYLHATHPLQPVLCQAYACTRDYQINASVIIILNIIIA